MMLDMMVSRGRGQGFALLYLELYIAMAAVAVLSVTAVVGQSLYGQVKVDFGADIEPEGVWVDAFNMSMCGRAEFRRWQKKERAFNCKSDTTTESSAVQGGQEMLGGGSRIDAQPKIVNGLDAYEGEFPSFVEVRYIYQQTVFLCGGALIANNLLVTAAHCVVNGSNLTLFFGSNRIYGQGGQKRLADKSCHPSDFDTVFDENGAFVGQHNDLAIIKFDEPIEYEPNKIWPACVNLDARHTQTATCALAGLGLTGIDLNASLPDHLKTLPVQRTCQAKFEHENSCYEGMMPKVGRLQGGQGGDSGSPVFCYDQCAEDNRTQAFVTGVLTDAFKAETWITTGAADLNLLKSQFLNLIEAARLDGAKGLNGTICKLWR